MRIGLDIGLGGFRQTPRGGFDPIQNTVVPEISGTAVNGQQLSTTDGTWTHDPDAGELTYTYQWKRDGVNIAGATANTYTIVGADVGTAITCVVTATDLSGSLSAESASVEPVYQSIQNTEIPVISGTAVNGQQLSTTDGTWVHDSDAGELTYTYQWKRDGVNITGATANTYTLTGSDVGADVSCEVTATDLSGSLSAESASVEPTYQSIANTSAPVVSGTAVVGNQLSTTNGSWTHDADAGELSYTYQWQRDGVDIPGATASTYTLVSADANTTVRCVVTATDASGSLAANSNGVAVSAPAASVSYRTFSYDSNTVSSHSMGTLDIGSADASRIVFLVIYPIGNSAVVSSASVGGVAGTLRLRVSNISHSVEIWSFAVPSGASGAVQVNLNSAVPCACAVWASYNLDSASPIDTYSATSTGDKSASLSSQSGGIMIGGASMIVASPSASWGGRLAESYDTVIAGTRIGSGAAGTTIDSSSAFTLSIGGSESVLTTAVATFR